MVYNIKLVYCVRYYRFSELALPCLLECFADVKDGSLAVKFRATEMKGSIEARQ